MLDNEMIKALRNLLGEPSCEHYLEAARLATALPGYDPDSLAVNDVDRLVEQGRNKDAVQRFVEIVVDWILSPRVHTLGGVAYEVQGNQKTAQLELRLSTALVTAILRTGDGSTDSPYKVTRLSDEYDALSYSLSADGKLEPLPRWSTVRQLQQLDDGRWLDTHHLREGGTVCFDISIAMSRPGAKGPLRSGDGREQSPFVLTSTADEDEILRYLLKPSPKSRCRLEREGRRYDVLSFEEDPDLWFDVTDAPVWA